MRRLAYFIGVFLGLFLSHTQLMAQPGCLSIAASTTTTSCFSGNDGQISLTITAGNLLPTPQGQPPWDIELFFQDSGGGLTQLAFHDDVSFTSIVFTPGNGSLNIAGAETFGIPSNDFDPGSEYRINVRSTGGVLTCRNKTLTNIQVLEPTQINGAVNTITTACTPGTGSISLDVSGGVQLGGGPPNYIYTWTGPTAIANTIEDPINLNAGSYNVTIKDALGCTLDILNIVVPVGPNAGANNTVSACNNNAAFNLFTNLLGTPDAGGTWSQLSGTARTITGNNVNMVGATAGAYTFEYRVTGAPCPDATAVVTVNAVVAPNAGANNTVSACNNNGAFNLFTSLAGTPDAGGSWTQLSGAARTITGDNVDMAGATAGAYTFRYTVTGTAPCANATAVVTVNAVVAPNAGLNNTVSACNNNAAFNLFTSLAGTPNAGGTWAQLSGAARTITGNNVNMAGATAGAYTFQYTVTGTAPCANATAVVTVNVVAAPNAGADNTVSACNNNGAFNLFTSLAGTPDAGGSWTQLSGAARTITGNNVDMAGAAAGAYTFRYTVTGTAPCANASAVVTVNVVTAPNAGLNNTVSACNNNGAFNLFTSLAGTPDAGGSWTQLSGAARTITGNNVNMAGATAGAYTFQYAVTGTAPCANATAVVTVNVVAAPNAGADNTVSACNNNAAFNLFTSLTGTPNAGGAWAQLSGAARTITGNNVNMAGAAAGAYTFQYTVTGTAPCANATAVVTVNVVTAPNAGTNNTVSACNNNASLNLFTSLLGTPDVGGVWSQLSGSARTITGNNVDLIGAAPGNYDFEYRVSAAPCADAIAVVTVNVSNPPDPGLDNTVNTCNSNAAFNLFTSLGGTPAAGGVWTEITSSGAPITGNNVNFVGIPGVSYQFQYTITATGCNPVSAIVTVDLFDVATATISGDATICTGQSSTITISLTGVGPWDIQYTDGGAPIAINGILSSPHTFSVSPVINTTYSLVSVTDTRCGAGTVSGSATITMSPIAGNPATFGNETWLAYVFDDSGSPAPPATNINFNNTKYRGFLNETEIASISAFSSYNVVTDAFNLNLSNTVLVAGPNICGSYLNDYSIRFRMTKTFAAGVYTFTVGADDGVRLLVDGVSVLPAGAFNVHAFTTYNSTPVCLTAGTHNLVLEYFDRGGFSRIDFNYSASPPPTVTTPVSLCVNSPAPTLTASSVGAISYKWYTDAALTNPPIFNGANYTPAAAQLDMTTVGTTDFFVTAVYACGETPAAQVTVDVTNGATINLPAPPFQICDSGGLIDLSTLVSATPSGGAFTFSGTNVTDPNFNPSGLAGTTVTITVGYTAGTCSASTTFDIDVVNNASITVPATAAACESAGIIDLNTLVSGNPGGGAFTFVGTGVTGSNFDPSGLNGAITITVDYNTGGCIAPTQMFDINVVPNVSFVVDNSTVVCPASGLVNLAALVTPSPAGGLLTFTGAGVAGSQFDPTGSAGSTASINVSYDLGGCVAFTTVQVTVRSAIDPLCGGPTGNCATVVITPVSTAAICSPTDGSIMFNINPATPTINNTGVRIDIIGTSATNLGIAQTNFNDPLFSGLAVGTYNYTIEYGDPGCIKTGQVTVLLGPDVVDFNITSNNVNCFGSSGGVVLSNINGSSVADYTYEVIQLGSVVSTGAITQLQSLGDVTVTGFGTGNFEIKLSQDQSGTTTCTSPVQSALKAFTVTSPAANLDTLYVNKKISVPDLPTGSVVVGISESLQEPYEVRLELTQPLFPGQVFAQDFTEAVRNTLNLKVEYTAPNLFAGGYLLTLRDGFGCQKNYTFNIAVDNNLMIPNIFTPNGDGVNEVFFIRNMPDATEVMLSNRWGKQVYASKNYQNDWDGGDIADGVYYYRIKAAGQSYTGWVEVLRGK